MTTREPGADVRHLSPVSSDRPLAERIGNLDRYRDHAQMVHEAREHLAAVEADALRGIHALGSDPLAILPLWSEGRD